MQPIVEVTVRMLDFILKQPKPINLSKITKLFWKDCRPPYDMDMCIKYLVDSEQIYRYIYTEGIEPNLRFTTVLGSAEVMAEFIAKTRPIEPELEFKDSSEQNLIEQ